MRQLRSSSAYSAVGSPVNCVVVSAHVITARHRTQPNRGATNINSRHDVHAARRSANLASDRRANPSPVS